MFDFLQIIAVLSVVLAAVPALAHALELPGKMRLTKDQYYAIQRIYYPGFTFAGIAEPAGVIALAVLLFAMPGGTADYWLTVVALIALVGMHAVYWIFTHPVNRFWLEEQDLSRAGAGFFSVGSKRNARHEPLAVDWTELRDRWEYSHLLRAALSTISLVALVIAVT